MSNELSLYNQLTRTPGDVFKVLSENSIKTDCTPFAVKLINALKELQIQTEQEKLAAADTVISGLQTLAQGGITPEDFDKMDFVKRGKLIVPSARVEAFYRAAARKGYRIFDDIIAVPKEDSATTYFQEHFYNGGYIYTLADARKNLDRAVTAERLLNKYFARFLCRLTIHEAKTNNIISVFVCEMSNDEMLEVSKTSEQGIFKSEWQEYTDNYGRTKKRKVVTEEVNTGSFWGRWTGEMVKKTIIRRALKRVKESLPGILEHCIDNTLFAFEDDEYKNNDFNHPAENLPKLEIPVEETNDVDLRNLTQEQKAECTEMYNLYCKNPKLATDDAARIKEMFESGKNVQEVINTDYASIMALKQSPKKWNEIGGYFIEEIKSPSGDTDMGKA